MTDRAHVTFPVVDEEGNLFLQAIVQLVDPETGNIVTPLAWTGPLDTDQPQPWPMRFSPSVVDIWLDQPGRYTVRITSTSQSFSRDYESVDFLPSATQTVRAPDTMRLMNPPVAGTWPQSNLDGSAEFTQPPLIPIHGHDGKQPGSTVLNLAVATKNMLQNPTFQNGAVGWGGNQITALLAAPGWNTYQGASFAVSTAGQAGWLQTTTNPMATSGSSYTFSAYIKGAAGKVVYRCLWIGSNSSGWVPFTLTGGWDRLSVTYNNNTSGALIGGVRAPDDGSVITISAAMLQTGTNATAWEQGTPSTVLTDQYPGQTWLGYLAGIGASGGGAQSSDAGYQATSNVSNGVSLGWAANVIGIGGTAVGPNTVAGAAGVSLGNKAPSLPNGVQFPSTIGNVNNLFISPTQISLRNAYVDSANITFGKDLSAPNRPNGVTEFIALLALNTIISGNLSAKGNVSLGVSGSTLSFMGGAGAKKATGSFTGASGALASLVVALRNLGILP